MNTIRVGYQFCEDAKETYERLNDIFQKVLTKKTKFEERRDEERGVKIMENIKVDKKEILGLLKSLNGKKAMSPDKILFQLLKVWSEQLI